MGLIDSLIHLFNLLLPAVGLGAISAGLAKLAWRRELRAVRWHRLAAWSAGASGSMILLGLLYFGQDGRMATYLGMVVACAGALWWAGFGSARR